MNDNNNIFPFRRTHNFSREIVCCQSSRIEHSNLVFVSSTHSHWKLESSGGEFHVVKSINAIYTEILPEMTSPIEKKQQKSRKVIAEK